MKPYLRSAWSRKETFFWVAILGLALTMQWPMWKGLYYRATGAKAESAIRWETSLESALAAARRQNRLVLADFGASWCPPCVAMEHDTWPRKDVTDTVMRSYVPLKVDVDTNSEVTDRYQVSGVPAILLLDPNGRIVRRAEGYLPPSGLLAFLKGD